MTEQRPPDERVIEDSESDEVEEFEDVLELLATAGHRLDVRQEQYVNQAWAQLYDDGLVEEVDWENWQVAALLTANVSRERLGKDVEEMEMVEYARRVLPNIAWEVIVNDDYMEATEHERLYKTMNEFSYDAIFKETPAEKSHLLRTAMVFIFMSGR